VNAGGASASEAPPLTISTRSPEDAERILRAGGGFVLHSVLPGKPIAQANRIGQA